jgi:hypothetical protein
VVGMNLTKIYYNYFVKVTVYLQYKNNMIIKINKFLKRKIDLLEGESRMVITRGWQELGRGRYGERLINGY